jgi:hypothetical protein
MSFARLKNATLFYEVDEIHSVKSPMITTERTT